MIGIIDVGGGLRGVYGAGVFDCCMDNDLYFGYCLGVSAGSANQLSYVSGQRGRNYRFYLEYTFRRDYMSIYNLIRKGSYLDLEYIYGALTNEDGEDPFDFDAAMASDKILKSVTLNALTGETVYFDSRTDLKRNDYYFTKTSSCMPLVCKPYMVDGVPYFDGGIADPVPIRKAFDDGCDKVALILTKPRDFIRDPAKDTRSAKLLSRKYPMAAVALADRARRYNEGVALAREYEAQGKAIIIAPDSIEGMHTLKKKKKILKKLYIKGYEDAKQLREFTSNQYRPVSS